MHSAIHARPSDHLETLLASPCHAENPLVSAAGNLDVRSVTLLRGRRDSVTSTNGNSYRRILRIKRSCAPKWTWGRGRTQNFGRSKGRIPGALQISGLGGWLHDLGLTLKRASLMGNLIGSNSARYLEIAHQHEEQRKPSCTTPSSETSKANVGQSARPRRRTSARPPPESKRPD